MPSPSSHNPAKADARVSYSTDPADFFYMGLNVPCQHACPAQTNVPAYIRAAYEKRYGASYEINRVVNILPGVLGRICSRPCEDHCRHGERELGEPVQICYIKRAASDFKAPGHQYSGAVYAPLGRKVCIVGAGPAGIAAAHDLNSVGFDVVVLEAFEKPGGMLRYGIPEFRLPRDIIDTELDAVLRMGVTLRTGVKVGVDVSLEELSHDFDAVLLAAGCYVSRELGVSGENLKGVFSGLEFVVDASNGLTPDIGKRVLVVGAGFTAFDCARSALRMGAEDVSICVRGLEEDLRVTRDEIHEAKREGVKIRSLLTSVRILGDAHVTGVEFVRTRPGEKGPNGRRSIESIQGSEFVLPADAVIAAVGQGAAPIPFAGETDKRGVIKADQTTFRTSLKNVYACGDYVTGPSTVIEAVSSGRKAAEQIARDVCGRDFREWAVRIEECNGTDRNRAWDFIPQVEMPKVEPASDRFQPAQREVELGFSPDAAEEETKRCYLCSLHYEIDVSRCIYCRYCIDNAPRDCIKLVEDLELNEIGAVVGYKETGNWRNVNAVVIDNSRCIRCGKCREVCPVDCISVSKVELVQRTASSGE